jgi:hypothetical protein
MVDGREHSRFGYADSAKVVLPSPGRAEVTTKSLNRCCTSSAV